MVQTWANLFPAWNTLYKEPRPKTGVTNAEWAGWVSEMAIAAKSEKQLQGGVNAFKTPGSVTQATFDTMRNSTGVSLFGDILYGGSPGDKAQWVSKTPPSSWVGKHKYPAQLSAAYAKDVLFGNALMSAETAWHALQAANAAGTTSGPVLTPGIIGTPPRTTATPVNLAPYAIMGGPGTAVAGTGTLGFAGGGAVGLSDVAAMFSPRFANGGQVPVVFNAAHVSQASAAMAQTSDGPGSRTLSAAANSSRIGAQFTGDITINNPVKEPGSTSITRAANRLSFLAGRGIA